MTLINKTNSIKFHVYMARKLNPTRHAIDMMERENVRLNVRKESKSDVLIP